MRSTPLVVALLLTGCASTAPTQIGADTYYAAKTNTAGAFGDPSALTGKLIVQGNQFCASKGREFQLVTQNAHQPVVGLGGSSITFKCVEHSQDVVMRPDNGVTTIENR